MGIFADLQAKISANREAGRDVPPVIEELVLLIADTIDPQEKPEASGEPAPTQAAAQQEQSPSNV